MRRAILLLLAIVVILVLALLVVALRSPPVILLLLGWLLLTTLQNSTPLVLTALGGMFSERSGVVNIGLEGIMLMGAFSAVATSWFTNDPWLGVLAGVLSGGLLAGVHAIVCVRLKGNQIVSGTGVILFASGFTTLMLWVIWGTKGTSDSVTRVPDLYFPGLEQIPIIGGIARLSPIVYLMFVIVVVSWYVLYHTSFGLRLRAAGEDPSTLDSAGVSVDKMRFAGVIISGLLGGLGGAYLSIGFESQFGKLMTNGRGFIALAALIFGNWTPLGCLIAGVLFGFLTGFQYLVQIMTGIDPGFAWLGDYSYFIQMIPYVLVVVALAGIRRSIPPKAVGTAYEKEATA